jgi:S1-C subfamily serine protease
MPVRRLLPLALAALIALPAAFAQKPPAERQPAPTPPAEGAKPVEPPKPPETPPRVELPDAVRQALPAVVKVLARIPGRARSAQTLGTERAGTGVVIDEDGLVLTVGYMILEADEVVVTTASGRKLPATVVAYDYETGFGLVRTAIPPKVTPVKLGDSETLKERDEALVAGFGGEDTVQRVMVTARREFAGFWEYLLEHAIFTVPPYGEFAGAALLSRDGTLLGIGSLQVSDAWRDGGKTLPGNVFLPVERLKPILADLVAHGRSEGKPKPWLGVYVTENLGRVVVSGTADGGPAAAAGVKRGDVIAGIAGQSVTDIADFYRKLWAAGEAGVDVRLQIERATLMRDITVTSGDRYKFIRRDNSL